MIVSPYQIEQVTVAWTLFAALCVTSVRRRDRPECDAAGRPHGTGLYLAGGAGTDATMAGRCHEHLIRAGGDRPGLVLSWDGVTVTVHAFDVAGDRITRIWATFNPDKPPSMS
jgi:hypothetical protein